MSLLLPSWIACAAVLLPLGQAAPAEEAATPEDPRYVFFMRGPDAGWHENRPESFTRKGFDEVAETLRVPENPRLRVGVSCAFSYMQNDVDVLVRSVRAVLDACRESRVPVLITFDGQNWWENRPDLWNWWDPDMPGYNPANAHNVEWTDWTPDSAVKIGWRNWGRQIRVRPAPNIASPVVLREHVTRLRPLAEAVSEWYQGLPPEERYLLGGVKVGWEAGIGYNAFHYPNGNQYIEKWPNDPSHDPKTGLDLKKGLAGGCAQLGYAAVKTAGIKSSGAITRDDIGEVTRRYLELLSRTVHEAGIPRHKLFTHMGGNYPPWGTHVPWWPAMNEYATPGWSFYGLDPATAGKLGVTLERQEWKRWAATEWWWGAPDAGTWHDHFARTLGFGDCRHICVYNWDCGFRFKAETAGHEALRKLVAEWREPPPTASGEQE